MADIISKACDFKVLRRKKTEACGLPVPNNEPTPVTVGTTRYLMDLCAKHQESLIAALQPYTSIASDTQQRNGTAVRKAIQGADGRPFTTKDVRLWLQAQGREVPEAGRLPQALLVEYQEAHGG
jgi:hypothetical protein